MTVFFPILRSNSSTRPRPFDLFILRSPVRFQSSTYRVSLIKNILQFLGDVPTIIVNHMKPNANPSGHAVQGMGLRPLDCWNCGFESSLGHGCLFVVGIVCCQVDVFAAGW